MITFLMNCLNLGAGLLFLGGLIISIKNLRKHSWRIVPLLLFSISGLAEVIFRLNDVEISANIYRQNNNLFLIALIVWFVVERKTVAEGLRQITQWLKTRFTHETIR